MTEEEAMAREAAADIKGYVGYDASRRRAFMDGWDAAMAHVEEERVRSCTADMEIK